jgi:hypothetical protein
MAISMRGARGPARGMNRIGMRCKKATMSFSIKMGRIHTGRVSFRNTGTRPFAEAIWGKHPEGDTWEFMYFVQPSLPLRCPAQSLADVLPAQYQGFAPISTDRVQNIVSKYESIENFIEKRMEGPGLYLLLRSNEDSSWSIKKARLITMETPSQIIPRW